MLELLAAVVSVDPPSLVGWLVFAFAAGMYPLGLMLGAPCSPCCPQETPCAINTYSPSFPFISAQYACDNESARQANTLGVSGTSASGLSAYFDSSRIRGSASVARSMPCENICGSTSLSPSYSFAGVVPTVTMTVSFNGNETEFKPYYSKFNDFSNHCFRHTTIKKASGSYVLSHVGGGVFAYQTTLSGSDLFQITASLHRCNDTPLWLIAVVFVSRSTASYCSLSVTTGAPDTSLCNASGVPLSTTKTLRCCVGHVLHYSTACVRTGGVFVDRVNCLANPLPTAYTLDVQDRAQLSVSGSLDISQRVTTSGNDNIFGNSTPRPGVVMPFTRPASTPPIEPLYGVNAPCRCAVREEHTFESAMPITTSYGGPYSLTVT